MATCILEIAHGTGESVSIESDSRRWRTLAYLIVLAEDTAQVTAGEEYGAAPVRTRDGWLLPTMHAG